MAHKNINNKYNDQIAEMGLPSEAVHNHLLRYACHLKSHKEQVTLLQFCQDWTTASMMMRQDFVNMLIKCWPFMPTSNQEIAEWLQEWKQQK